MDYHLLKDLLNRYFARYAGGEQRPTFFDVDTIAPALNDLSKNFLIIKKEFERILVQRPRLPAYHEIDPGEHEISNVVDKEKSWKVFMLQLLRHKPVENRQLCPETCALLNRVPNIIQAFFSILEPGKSIPLHNGPYLGYLRYHLGLQIPKVSPPLIEINDQPYTWQEGEHVLFDDTWPHQVKNTSQELRALLIVDILRPMPKLPHFINKAMTYGLGSPFYGRSVVNRVKKFNLITQN